MAKPKSVKTVEKSLKRVPYQDWKNTKYVINNLSDDELAAMDGTQFDMERYGEFLELVVDEGMSVKIDFDNWSFAYKVTLTGSWVGYPNTGYAVSGRSSSLLDAFKIVWFKYDIIANRNLESVYVEAVKTSKRG